MVNERGALRQTVEWASLILWITGLGWLDFFSGHELNFFVFYFIPIGLAAYRLGFLPAVISAAGSAAVWAMADRLAGREYSSPMVAGWNTLIRLLAFLTFGAAIARLRTLLGQQQAMSRELQKTLDELRVLKGLLPICAYCKQIRDDEGNWHQLEAYITERSMAVFSHGMCPACKRRVFAEAGLPGGSQDS